MMILRYIFTLLFITLFIIGISIGITFYTFPVISWQVLFDATLFDLPFLVVLIGIPFVIVIVIGFILGLNYRQNMRYFEKQINEVINGRKISNTATKNEFIRLEEKLKQLQNSLLKQTELAQRQATERTKEKEKGLQEVVIQERNRLARELHDSVSQQLFAASMMMSAVNEGNQSENNEIKRQLAMIEKMIHQSQLEMRALLLHLRPVALKGKSLQEGAEELLIELKQKVPLDIQYQIEAFPVEKGIEDHLFRILQESVSNTLRHAKATKLELLLIERDDFIIMRVLDDGIGFKMDEVKTSSYGLSNMKERILEVGGTFKVVSLPQQGTRVDIKIPQLKKGEELS